MAVPLSASFVSVQLSFTVRESSDMEVNDHEMHTLSTEETLENNVITNKMNTLYFMVPCSLRVLGNMLLEGYHKIYDSYLCSIIFKCLFVVRQVQESMFPHSLRSWGNTPQEP
jgi:hypothetical protein